MEITERPIWDAERGLMTIDEHYEYLQEAERQQRKALTAERTAARLADNLFNIADVDKVWHEEQKADGLQWWQYRRIRYALSLALFEYWPKEWRSSPEAYPWDTAYTLPESFRNGRTMTEIIRCLIVHCLRTRNTKAAVRGFLLRPRAFLDREERYLVRRRLAK